VKAVVCTRYGPPEVLQLAELDAPVPRHDQVRVRIHATAVTSSDSIMRGFKVPARMWVPARLVLGVTRPRRPVLGTVFAGEVESLGRVLRMPSDSAFSRTCRTC
jgi:NADPH:quinone reductase-like Zn-dependent oxidoreductase